MTVASYLYTACITICCAMIFAGYSLCYAAGRKRSYLLMLLLYALYLASELLRILFFLTVPAGSQYPDAIVIAAECLMDVLYFLIIWDQSQKPLTKPEVVFLCVMSAAVYMFSFIPRTQPISHRLGFYVYLWGFYKLYSLRGRDPRTKAMFTVVSLICVYHLLLNTASLFIPMEAMFSYGSPFALTAFYHEIVFYIIITASVLDLFTGFKKPAYSDDPTPDYTSSVVSPPPPISPIQQIVDKYGLSNREKDVFELLVQGKSNIEISKCLFISEGTVKVHIHNIYQKLGIANRRQINQILLEQSGSLGL